MIRLLKLKEVSSRTTLARSTIYKYMQQGTFPKPVSLGAKSVAWVEAEIEAWIIGRVDLRDEGKILLAQ